MTTDLTKVDGSAGLAESFTGDLNFVKVEITAGGETFRSDAGAGSAGLKEDGTPRNKEQYLYDKMVEVINQVSQPLVLTGGTTGSDTFYFVTEHTTAWEETGAANAGAGSAVSLKDELDTNVTAIKNPVTEAAIYSGSFAVTVTAGSSLEDIL